MSRVSKFASPFHSSHLLVKSSSRKRKLRFPLWFASFSVKMDTLHSIKGIHRIGASATTELFSFRVCLFFYFPISFFFCKLFHPENKQRKKEPLKIRALKKNKTLKWSVELNVKTTWLLMEKCCHVVGVWPKAHGKERVCDSFQLSSHWDAETAVWALDGEKTHCVRRQKRTTLDPRPPQITREEWGIFSASVMKIWANRKRLDSFTASRVYEAVQTKTKAFLCSLIFSNPSAGIDSFVW